MPLDAWFREHEALTIDPQILQNQDIICFSSIDWDFIWQMPQEIASRLADNGNRVLFVDNTGVRTPNVRDASRIWMRLQNWKSGRYGIRHVRTNIDVYSPLVLPLPYSPLVRPLNAYLMRRTIRRWARMAGFTNPIVLTFLPTGLTLDTARAVDYRLLVYYCLDNFAASSTGARGIVETEAELVREADLVLATSQELKERLQRLRPDVYRYPSGVSLEPFVLARDHRGEDPLDCPRPRVGYIGGLHRWIDWPLLEETVAASPEWSFVFVGPAQCDEVERISSYPNVFLVDTQPHDRLPRYIDAFDVCLIPYQVNAYTENVYPVKMNEYLAMGKPVVSTPLREVKGFNDDHGPLVALADTAESFREAIAAELAGDDGAKVQDRYRAAEANSYVSRLREISALIENRIGERMSRPVLDREKALSSTAGVQSSRREAL